jgi:N-terminal half of MaoC dehydratase
MTFEMPVELGKVREFARAVRSRHPDHRGSEASMPPTMLTCARLLWQPRAQDPIAELGFDMRRLLHGEEEYVFHGPPPRVGQVLEVSTRIADAYEKPGMRGGVMRFGVVVSEFRDEEGALVAEQRTVYIETAKAAK